MPQRGPLHLVTLVCDALQATVRTETVRCLEPLLHLPKALARSLPVTEITALSPASVTDQRYSANGFPALPAADRDVQSLKEFLSNELALAAQDIAAQQVSIHCTIWLTPMNDDVCQKFCGGMTRNQIML